MSKIKHKMGSVRKRGTSWQIDYYHNGHRVRRTLEGCSSESEALAELRRVNAEIHQRRHIPREDRLSFSDLIELIGSEYQIKARRSVATMRFFVAHLKAFFQHYRAIDLQPDAVQRYQLHRLKQKASPASINRETACLHHMLVIACAMGKLSRVPKFEKLPGEQIREGFLSFADFDAILAHVEGEWRKAFLEFAFLTGWRVGRVRSLEWKQIFLNDAQPYIKTAEGSATKATGSDLPLTGRLRAIIETQHQARRLDCPYVFHNDGRRIGDLRKSWGNACKNAGYGHILLHDFRRSIARNLTSAGIPMPVVMARCGWKTTSTFLRYRIVDHSDQQRANDVLDRARAQVDQAKIAAISSASQQYDATV